MKKYIIAFLFFINTHSYSEIINKVEIVGNDRVSKETIMVYGDISLKSDYKIEDLNEILKKLYETNFFNDIKLSINNGILEIAVKEALDGPDKLYISVDVDVMDPAYAPATGTPEPGGISSLELLRAIRKIVLSKGMVGMDVVEVSPVYDQPGDITAQAAHRCVYEAISALAKIKSMKNEI